jgi:hypothetical protein
MRVRLSNRVYQGYKTRHYSVELPYRKAATLPEGADLRSLTRISSRSQQGPPQCSAGADGVPKRYLGPRRRSDNASPTKNFSKPLGFPKRLLKFLFRGRGKFPTIMWSLFLALDADRVCRLAYWQPIVGQQRMRAVRRTIVVYIDMAYP